MRWYRALLHLYPRSFRHEYGGEMSAVFRQELCHAPNVLWRVAHCLAALWDVSRGASAVHLDILGRDLKSVSRQVLRAPGFAATAVLVIALGIGANTAVFAVADFALFRPLAFPDSGRLVKLWESRPGYGQLELSPPNYRDWRQRNTSVASMAAVWRTAANVTDQGDPFRTDGARVTGEFFDVLGMAAMRGRALGPADVTPGARPVVVLGHRLWQSRFGGDSGVVGQSIRLDGEPHQVIGVMPPDFAFPTRATQYWAPLVLNEDDNLDRTNNFLLGVARLRPGVSLDEARRDFGRVASTLEAEHPVENERAGASVSLVRDSLSTRARVLLVALLAAATCVLLIAGVNLANLMLARGLARRQELAVRAALGAGRDRLTRQLVTELLCLSLAGGLAGVVVGAWTLPLLVRLVPEALPITGEPAVDLRVVAVAGLAMLVLTFVAGLWPLARGGAVHGRLLEAGPRGGVAQGERVRGALVVVGIASSMVLLATSGLLLRTLSNLQGVPTGFEASAVTVARTALPRPEFEQTPERVAWLRDVIESVEAVPGIERAAYVSFAPMTMGGGIWPVEFDAGDVRREAGQVASLRFATPGYFDAIGVPVLQGRDLSWSDTPEQPAVAVVSASFANRFWPGAPAIGKRFGFAFLEREVVGVVGDISNRGPEQITEPQVYLPAAQVPDGGLWFYTPQDLVVRGGLPAGEVEQAVRRIIGESAPNVPVSSVRPLAAIVAEQTAARSVQVRVIGAFAAVALLLAGLGIHGLLGFVVSERRREIGVRMALGADPGGIVRLVLMRSARLVAAGLVPGLVLAAIAGRSLSGILVGVTPRDVVSFGGAAALCIVAALLGSALPARRAASVDPSVALRSD